MRRSTWVDENLRHHKRIAVSNCGVDAHVPLLRGWLLLPSEALVQVQLVQLPSEALVRAQFSKALHGHHLESHIYLSLTL